MELSMLVAKGFSLYLLAIGIGILSGNLNLEKMLNEYQGSSVHRITTGFMLIVLGILLVDNHNFWVKDWTVLVTIISWSVLIKGILFIAFPKTYLDFGKKFVLKTNTMGVIVIALGILFGYFGFVA